jgi:hypothetical protein
MPSIAGAVSLGSWDSPRTPPRLRDADGCKPILPHNCSRSRNEFREKDVMIAPGLAGTTMLGAPGYSDADRP